jgi:hypothetical protein
MPHKPAGDRLHDAADVSLSRSDDIDKRLAVQTKRHRAPQIALVEGRFIPVDQQVAVDAARCQLADRLG